MATYFDSSNPFTVNIDVGEYLYQSDN